MTLGEKIKELRKQNNLTQDELASKLNISRRSVIDWEHDKFHPQTELLLEIAELFNCDINYFIETEKKPDIINDIRGSFVVSNYNDYKLDSKELKFKKYHSKLLIISTIFILIYFIFSLILNNIEVYLVDAVLILIYIICAPRIIKDYEKNNLFRKYICISEKYNDLILTPYMQVHAVISDRLLIKNKEDVIVDTSLDNIDHIELYKDIMMMNSYYPKQIDLNTYIYGMIICYNDGSTSKISFVTGDTILTKNASVYTRMIMTESFNTLKMRCKK